MFCNFSNIISKKKIIRTNFVGTFLFYNFGNEETFWYILQFFSYKLLVCKSAIFAISVTFVILLLG